MYGSASICLEIQEKAGEAACSRLAAALTLKRETRKRKKKEEDREIDRGEKEDDDGEEFLAEENQFK